MGLLCRTETESVLHLFVGDVLEQAEKRPDAPEAPGTTPVELSVETSAEPAVETPAKTLGELAAALPAPSVAAPTAAPPAVPPAVPSAPSTPPARRRRGPLLFVGATVLGLVAGACAGYLVQADRAPTKLPSLSQPRFAQAKGEPEPLSAAQDARLRTDGDLRRLLLKKPAGAEDAEWLTGADGWLDQVAYAESYEKPADAFEEAADEHFRRAAVVGWTTGSGTDVEIRLVQYRQEESLSAEQDNENNQYWSGRRSGTRSWALPGTRDGRAYVHSRPETRAGYQPQYGAEAFAWRGDVCLEILVTDTQPVPKATIMRLAERQLERL